MGKFCKQNSPIHKHRQVERMSFVHGAHNESEAQVKQNRKALCLLRARTHTPRWLMRMTPGTVETLVALVVSAIVVSSVWKATKYNDSEPNEMKRKKNVDKAKENNEINAGKMSNESSGWYCLSGPPPPPYVTPDRMAVALLARCQYPHYILYGIRI